MFSIHGTADRSEWWAFSLLSSLLSQLAAVAGVYLWSEGGGLRYLLTPLLLAVAGCFVWLSIAVTVRRLHDRDRPGWFIFFSLVPVVGWLWLLVECGLLPGERRGAHAPRVFRSAPSRSGGADPPGGP